MWVEKIPVSARGSIESPHLIAYFEKNSWPPYLYFFPKLCSTIIRLNSVFIFLERNLVAPYFAEKVSATLSSK